MNSILENKEKLMEDEFYKDGYELGLLSRDMKDIIKAKIILITNDERLSNKEIEIEKFNFIKQIANEKNYLLIEGLDNITNRFYFMLGLIDGVTEYEK